MTSTPNPQIVCEIARKYVLSDRHRAHDVGPAVLAAFGPDGLTKPEYHAYCDAVRRAIRTARVTMSCLDEQPQDGYAVRVLDMLEADPDRFQACEEEDLRAVLHDLFQCTAEVSNLANVLNSAQAERDGDVRAVDNAIKAITLFWSGEAPIETLAEARAQLIEHYGSQIATLDAAALEARDAKEAS